MRLTYLIIICIIYFINNTNAQGPFVFPRVLSKPKTECENQVKVKDLYTENCGLEAGCNYLYPVLVENFDHNFDLPNKWGFTLGYTHDDDFGGMNDVNKKSTWFKDGYYHNIKTDSITNHNIKLNNGIATFSFIIENVPRINNNGSFNYPFTSGMISSLSRFRTGVFEARIKVPTVNKMWPAFWLLGNKLDNYAEIDIFEFFDDDVSPNSICESYDYHQMTIHTGPNNTKGCKTGDKYPFAINDWHLYKLDWNDYEVKISVDGIPVGYAAKYFLGFNFVQSCVWNFSASNFDPRFTYNCQEIQGLPDNLLPTIPYINYGPRPWWLPNIVSWPPPQPPQPYLASQIRQDSYFPKKGNAMSLVINNNANSTYKNHDFLNYQQANLDMLVDYVRVYQPFCCGVDKSVCTLNDLDNISYNTGILTGRNLSVGCSNINNNFRQYKPGSIIVPGAGPDWRDIPVILLATDEIAILGDAFFEGDTYVEMRITDCGNQARPDQNENKLWNDFYQRQTPSKDSLLKQTEFKIDSIVESEFNKTMEQYKEKYYLKTEEYFNISPIPTKDKITISLPENLFDEIKQLNLVDLSGREFELLISKEVNIESFANGVYFLKFIFKDDSKISKKIIKN
ncbi:MAG: family 16 glycosylhydrolase [Sphingobacteriaceae bacterium]|nr:family 16 glycosylhydrolase [Sphingobacteriaceae bacterium]